MSPRDMARMDWLWLNRGNWNVTQVIPAEWIDKATRVLHEILDNEPEERHVYELGFWCNDQSQVWPNLPKDSFAASGAGQQHIWVCPSLDLIGDRRTMQGLLGRIIDSLTN